MPGVQDSDDFLKPWKYFSRKSRWAGTWLDVGDSEEPPSSTSTPRDAVAYESNVGRGYDPDVVALRIVIN
jgi:hypothetical protein